MASSVHYWVHPPVLDDLFTNSNWVVLCVVLVLFCNFRNCDNDFALGFVILLILVVCPFLPPSSCESEQESNWCCCWCICRCRLNQSRVDGGVGVLFTLNCFFHPWTSSNPNANSHPRHVEKGTLCGHKLRRGRDANKRTWPCTAKCTENESATHKPTDQTRFTGEGEGGGGGCCKLDGWGSAHPMHAPRSQELEECWRTLYMFCLLVVYDMPIILFAYTWYAVYSSFSGPRDNKSGTSGTSDLFAQFVLT